MVLNSTGFQKGLLVLPQYKMKFPAKEFSGANFSIWAQQ